MMYNGKVATILEGNAGMLKIQLEDGLQRWVHSEDLTPAGWAEIEV